MMVSNNLPKSVESAHDKTWNAYLFLTPYRTTSPCQTGTSGAADQIASENDVPVTF